MQRVGALVTTVMITACGNDPCGEGEVARDVLAVEFRPSHSREIEYDAEGRIAFDSTSDDAGQVWSRTRNWDADGRLIEEVSCNVFSCTRYQHLLDRDGRVVETVETVVGSGVQRIRRFTFDDDGRKIRETCDGKCQTFGPQLIDSNPEFIEEWAYDDLGQLLSYTKRRKQNGVMRGWTQTTYTYEENGRLIRGECDGGLCTSLGTGKAADGLIDEATVEHLDSAGRRIWLEVDKKADGTIDAAYRIERNIAGDVVRDDYESLGVLRMRTEIDYDAEGRVVREREDGFRWGGPDADGVFDRVTTYQYDAEGHLVHEGSAGGIDAPLNNRVDHTYENGRLTRTVSDQLADGQPEEIRTLFYDRTGRLVMEEWETTARLRAWSCAARAPRVDGVIDKRITYDYDIQGRLAGSATSSWADVLDHTMCYAYSTEYYEYGYTFDEPPLCAWDLE